MFEQEKGIKQRIINALRLARIEKRIGLINEGQAKDRDDLMERNKFGWYDSEIITYERDFHDVLSPFESFNEFLKKVYASKKGQLIGIELGGPGVNLFEGFERDIFKKTAGITLKKLPEHEGKINHEVIEADVFLRDSQGGRSWNTVLDWVEKNGKPDFIIERMVGPLGSIRDKQFFLMILDRWYKILNENGCMFIQLPKIISMNDYSNIFSHLREKFADQKIALEARVGFGEETGLNVFYLRKLENAPDSLLDLFK